ncbi:MAG: dihydrolipoamide acetyltransferase component of pyruvate dehydrogenase complex [Dehalococcoidia bacterium]|nr:MAG: dihydrolipoamide acetyltransferase component of pyruvate dehydrogenase complex [Dehalococcoidia bacterium]
MQVIMPVLGLTMEEGTVSAWLKAEGEPVVKDEPLLLVETDKATVEVPAPASGVLTRILVPPGRPVAVRTPIAEIAAEEDRTTAPSALPPEQAAPPAATSRPAAPPTERRFVSPRARRVAREQGVDLAHIAGSGFQGRIVERDVLGALPARRVTATPLAERIAAERGIPLEGITGSGPRGRVTREDVLAAAGGPVIPLSRVRKLTAERMAASARTAPHVTLFLDADLEEAARFRAQLAPEFARLGVPKLPWDAILAKAAALALAEHPALNARWVEGEGIRRHSAVHVGVATALEPEGLVVPVLRDAGTRTLRELAADLLALIERARAGRLGPDDLAGGTFTITNLGGQRIDAFTPIINPPEAAILGIGRIAEKPAVRAGQLVIRTQATLALSFDHRVVDGAPAAAFLARLAELLERPYALLGV